MAYDSQTQRVQQQARRSLLANLVVFNMSNIYHTEPPTHGKVLLHTSFGDIDVELWSKECPKACRNFVQLASEGVRWRCMSRGLSKTFTTVVILLKCYATTPNYACVACRYADRLAVRRSVSTAAILCLTAMYLLLRSAALPVTRKGSLVNG